MNPGDYSGPDRRRGGPDRRDPGQRVKILLVDDHALFRVGMRQILESQPDFDVVDEAEDSRGAIDAAGLHTPDIVLLDLSLPAPGGIETTQRVKREVPSAGIIASDAIWKSRRCTYDSAASRKRRDVLMSPPPAQILCRPAGEPFRGGAGVPVRRQAPDRQGALGSAGRARP